MRKRQREEEAAERRRQEAEERRRMERMEAERQSKILQLKAERGDLQTKLAQLKGLFSGGRCRELEARLSQIEEELSKL